VQSIGAERSGLFCRSALKPISVISAHRSALRSAALIFFGATENAGLENDGPSKSRGVENAGLESDELRLKQPQTSSTTDVSELSQNCVGLLHEVVDVRVHFCSKVPYYRTVLRQQFFFA